MDKYSPGRYDPVSGRYIPADLSATNAEAAAAANTKSADSFTVKKSGLNVVMNGKYQFSFSYLYSDPNNASNLIPGTRSPNFVFTLQTPDLTQPVTNLVVTPSLLSYGVNWTLIDKALAANKWLIDIQIYESLTGAFAGEEYLVWNGNGNSATILVSNTANRWIRVDTRDQDYRKKSVSFGPFKAIDPIVVDTTGPGNVGSVTATGSLDLAGVIGFHGHATISWSAVTGGGIRGYRIRWREVATTPTAYSYVDSPGTGTTYHLQGLGVGLTYEFAVATYDEYNNTSTQYVAGNNITITGTPYIAGTVDVAGYFRAKANPTDADSTAFKFGYGIETGKRGLAFNANNYWHIDSNQSALFKVGGSTSNYLLWDGSTFVIDGNITARGGQFSGNIFMSTTGASIYSGTIDATTGNLTGNGFALNSTGLKVANGTKSVTISAATGTITANGGSIAGWALGDNTFSKNNIILDSTGNGKIQVGASAQNSVYLGTETSGGTSFLMWAGNNTPDANAKFKIGADGTLYAVGAVFGLGSSIAGYATSTQLSAVSTTATNASNTATTAASDANTARITANAAKATADAALPSSNFNRDAIVNSINSSTTTTTISGGKITTGTISSDAVVSTFISAFSIDASKITTGMLVGRDIDIGNDSAFNRFKTSYPRSTGPNSFGPYSVLGINGIAMIGVGNAGVVSHWYPFISGESDIGVVSPSTYIWRNIRATNGTIVTSDRRSKTEILDADLGLNFINLLRPVKYKKYYEPNAPFLDEDNEPMLNEDGSRMVDTSKNYYGTRNHYGFIAQEVKEALDQVGVGSNFSGWALADISDPESQQSLSYDKFIAPMAKAIQELSDMVESLQQEVNTLKGI
jgi:hypothetical protein